MTDIEDMQNSLYEAAATVESLTLHLPAICGIGDTLAEAFRQGKKLLACGNGGSAADAHHFTTEWVGRFVKDRPSYPAIALTADGSLTSSLGNDYGFDQIFARQIEGFGLAGDVFFGFSTSGNSHNVLNAFESAKARKMHTVALLGRDGGRMAGIADHEVIIGSMCTARIQEAHGLIIHLLCEHVERALGHN